jgi:hypothetical protein
MKKFLLGLAALPFLAGVAFAAEKVVLSDKQMDRVAAGSTNLSSSRSNVYSVGTGGFTEIDFSNTSIAGVSITVKPSNAITCSECYLLISNPVFSVGTIFGPVSGPVSGP